jgi:RimJ/RimL family protein N-acetyltransferase
MEQLGLRHIVSLIHPSNEQSIRVAEKLGERLEGHHRVRGFDLLVYGSDLPLRGHAG